MWQAYKEEQAMKTLNMKTLKLKRSMWLWAAALFATLFGLLTIISGGSVLFSNQAQQAAGNYVPFVVWFNFLAGFAYIAAGIGLWFEQRWAVWLSFLIAGVTLVIFAIFGGHIWSGGAYELRTVAALGLRLTVWLTISTIAYQQLNPKSKV
jgi:hypothetical protein